jgi:nucleotide-binding universal stress UspA family protein
MVRGFRRILVPHDFSTHADRALATALRLTATSGATITVLHVASDVLLRRGFPPVAIAHTPAKAMLATLEGQLAARVARVTRGVRGVASTLRVVTGDPHQRILEASRGVDAIVMGTLGRGALTHLLVGSVAEKVVRHAAVPVLTVRARR